MSDQEIASTSVTSVSQQAESNARAVSEKKPATEAPKKVEAPSPEESVAQSSVRVSNAVSVSSESISPERMAELISELEAKLPTTASKGLQFTMDGRPIDAGFIAADQAGVGRDFFRTWIDENEMTSGHHELM